jgi:hypothetical protein
MAQYTLARAARGEAPNDRAAAREAIRLLHPNGLSDSAVEDRLRRKFRRQRQVLLAALPTAQTILTQ